MFRNFPTFSRICIFFLLTLSLLWSSLFYSSLLSDPFHLCFASVHIVGSLTSKLPWIILISYLYFFKYCIIGIIPFMSMLVNSKFRPLMAPKTHLARPCRSCSWKLDQIANDSKFAETKSSFIPQQRKLLVFSHSKGSRAGQSSQIRTAQGCEPGSQEGSPFPRESLGAAKSARRRLGTGFQEVL